MQTWATNLSYEYQGDWGDELLNLTNFSSPRRTIMGFLVQVYG